MMRRSLPPLSVGLLVLCGCHGHKPAPVTSHATPHGVTARGDSFLRDVFGIPGDTAQYETPLGPNGGGGGGQTAGAGGANDGSTSNSPSSGGGSSSSAPPTITESDVYDLEGNTLYIVNHYRGLQVVDITNPDQPALIGQAPIYSWPSEMYVAGTNAYVLDSDYYDYWYDNGINWSHGSRVHVFDISNPAAPQELSSVKVDGEINDSRIVGNVLYLIATRYSWWDNPASTDDTSETVIVSVDVSNPANVQIVQTQEFPQNGWDQQIMVTPYTVYVANVQWNEGTELYTTNIQYVDISDENGQMTLRGSINVPGMVQDRWSMDEYDNVLRVASSQGWSTGSGFLTTWSVANPDSITQVGSYSLNTGNALTTARFDGPNGYLVASTNVNPLYVFDLSNPAQPALVGQPQMNGYINYLSPQGNQMLSLGQSQSTDANGYTTYALQVSLFNTTPQQRPALLSQVTVGADWGWVPSSSDDYAKVFQILHLADHGLIAMPFQSWDSTSYKYIGGVQLIDFSASQLTTQGLIQNAGDVERGVPDGNLILTVADDVFQIMDITNEAQPVRRGHLELSRDVQDFAPLDADWGVQLSGDWYQGDMSIVTTPLLDPDNPSPPAELHIPAPYGRLFTNGDMAYVAGVLPWNGNTSPVTVVQVADLTNRGAPTLRGSVALPALIYPGYDNWYWGSGDEVAQINGSTLAFHQYEWGWYGCDDCVGGPGEGGGGGSSGTPPHTIYLVDLSNPDEPKVASTIPLDDASWAWGLKAVGSTLYISQYKGIFRNGQYFARYSVNRIDASDPAHPRMLGEVSIPGQFIAAEGDEIFTVEQAWNQGTSMWNTYLHALQLNGDFAILQSTVELPGYIDNVIVSGNTAFASAWQESQGSNGTWTESMQLVAVDLTNPDFLTIASNTTLPVQYAYLQAVAGGKAFFGMYPGLLAYDITTPAAPVFAGFFRTEGWSNELILQGSNLFVPSGNYGVQIVNLAGAP
jgi:hypothetical protein